LKSLVAAAVVEVAAGERQQTEPIPAATVAASVIVQVVDSIAAAPVEDFGRGAHCWFGFIGGKWMMHTHSELIGILERLQVCQFITW